MSRPPRIDGFSYLGPYRYFLTFCTRSRDAAFVLTTVVEHTLMQFRRTARDEAFAILAYCFMPDHVHFLVEGTRAEDDAKAVARYIVANPVRAGLVVSPRDYPHCGSDVWTIQELIESVR
jgi:hypothetical protein